MLLFTLLHPRMTHDALGLIPEWLDQADPRPIKEQLGENYDFAGGWRPIKGFTIDGEHALHYPGDEPLKPIATASIRDETIYAYPHAIFAIVQKDGTFEAARLD